MLCDSVTLGPQEHHFISCSGAGPRGRNMGHLDHWSLSAGLQPGPAISSSKSISFESIALWFHSRSPRALPTGRTAWQTWLENRKSWSRPQMGQRCQQQGLPAKSIFYVPENQEMEWEAGPLKPSRSKGGTDFYDQPMSEGHSLSLYPLFIVQCFALSRYSRIVWRTEWSQKHPESLWLWRWWRMCRSQRTKAEILHVTPSGTSFISKTGRFS